MEIQQVPNDKTEPEKKGVVWGAFGLLRVVTRYTTTDPRQRRALLRLAQQGTLPVMAATLDPQFVRNLRHAPQVIDSTESSAESISMCLAHFQPASPANPPTIAEKVQAELRILSKTASRTKLEQLPYLSGRDRPRQPVIMRDNGKRDASSPLMKGVTKSTTNT